MQGVLNHVTPRVIYVSFNVKLYCLRAIPWTSIPLRFWKWFWEVLFASTNFKRMFQNTADICHILCQPYFEAGNWTPKCVNLRQNFGTSKFGSRKTLPSWESHGPAFLLNETIFKVEEKKKWNAWNEKSTSEILDVDFWKLLVIVFKSC